MLKNKFPFVIAFIVALLSFCFACNKNFERKLQSNIFSGDSTITNKNYFKDLTNYKGYPVIKKQNDLYHQNFSNFDESYIYQLKKKELNYKLQKKISGKQYKIVLYTIINDTKKDSVEFYRNILKIRGNDSYSCLSYLDLKKNEIWQIRVFSSLGDKSLDFISFKKSKVLKSGIIQTDSLFYLDEALETDLYNYKIKNRLD